MAISNSARRLATSITGAALMALSSAGFAADPSTAVSAPTKQMREQMASMHEQMAACLRSDKSMAECRTEMMQHCQEMMGAQGCSTMMSTGGMMGMGGGMHGHMGSHPPASSSPPK